MTYEQQKDIVKSHVCLDCGADLVLVHDPASGGPAIRCGKDKGHLEYCLPADREQRIRRGEFPPGATPADRTSLLLSQEVDSRELERSLGRDLETGEAVPRELQMATLEFAIRAKLNPWLGHVCVYRGKPRVTVDGYYFHAANRGHPVRVAARPMTAQERLDYSVGEGDWAWLARAYQDGEDMGMVAIGIVTAAEIGEKSTRNPSQWRSPVVHNHPQRMAEKRAEWQLLRKLVPLGIEEDEPK